jgi:HD-GYP domain-containing protein (c-di-GMP phosphodiesterase class II)
LRRNTVPAEAFIDVPEDVVVPIEALDGAVGHCRVVSLLSYAIADRVGLNEATKRIVMRAGYLQNIGKEAVSHRILNSPRSLTDQESGHVEKYVTESVAACRRLGYVDSQFSI